MEATLELLRMIQTQAYNYIHLISGNDCLIKPVSYILTLFSERNRKEYIESNILPGDSTWSWAGQDRYQCWYPQWLIKRPAYKTARFLRITYREFVMRTKIFKRKKYPVKVFGGGSSWFSITGKCVKWMLEYLETHPEYIQFFRRGVCVDEVFFSTLVRQSPFAENILNDHLRFMIWDNTFSGGPKALEKSDIETMRKSKCVFARKVTDMNTLREIYFNLCKE